MCLEIWNTTSRQIVKNDRWFVRRKEKKKGNENEKMPKILEYIKPRDCRRKEANIFPVCTYLCRACTCVLCSPYPRRYIFSGFAHLVPYPCVTVQSEPCVPDSCLITGYGCYIQKYKSFWILVLPNFRLLPVSNRKRSMSSIFHVQ